MFIKLDIFCVHVRKPNLPVIYKLMHFNNLPLLIVWITSGLSV